jgi:hypothetical protein
LGGKVRAFPPIHHAISEHHHKTARQLVKHGECPCKKGYLCEPSNFLGAVKLTRNRLLGQVIASNGLVAAFLMSE